MKVNSSVLVVSLIAPVTDELFYTFDFILLDIYVHKQ